MESTLEGAALERRTAKEEVQSGRKPVVACFPTPRLPEGLREGLIPAVLPDGENPYKGQKAGLILCNGIYMCNQMVPFDKYKVGSIFTSSSGQRLITKVKDPNTFAGLQNWQHMLDSACAHYDGKMVWFQISFVGKL